MRQFKTPVSRAYMCSLPLAQFALLIVQGYGSAPVSDECAHVSAGLSYWQTGDTRTFNVNPPFVRVIGTLPMFVSGQRVVMPAHSAVERPEFQGGRKLFIESPEVFRRGLFWGRCLVASSALLAQVTLFYWGQRCGVAVGGLMACALWAFQPQVIAHGSLITSDVACAALMLACVWQLDHTMQTLSLPRLIALGGLLALAILAKFTALVLIPVLLLAAAWQANKYSVNKLSASVGLVAFVTLLVLAVPYRFEGWGLSLRDYSFLSGLFADTQAALGSLGCYLPVPMPEQLLLGLDRQQLDFERGLPSYAAGLRGNHGWWWFYLYSMLVKLPVGTLLAITIAGGLLAMKWTRFGAGLGLPLLTVGVLIVATGLQDGFAQQHRYILPAYPFLFLIVGVVGGRALDCEDRLLRVPVHWFGRAILAGVVLTIVGCLSAAPNWLSAFNSFAGGNTRGFKCLFNDASDWGQDTYRVRDWINVHQGKVPIYVHSSISGHDEIRAAGAEEFQPLLQRPVSTLPRPCWLVVSKTDFVMYEELSHQLEPLSVTEFIGGTHLVYYLSE